jgi:Ca2+-binding RTX toxin-like protein
LIYILVKSDVTLDTDTLRGETSTMSSDRKGGVMKALRKAIGIVALGVALLATPALAGTTGGTGDDYIKGTSGSDYLTGGPGDDIIVAGPGQDVVVGGPGFDSCYVGGRDVVKSCEAIF